jgi:PAS domain S-box-containing protein
VKRSWFPEEPGQRDALPITSGSWVKYASDLDIKKLRTLTVVVPIAFLLILEVLSLTLLQPLFGNSSTLRLFVIFLILIVAIIPFSFWVFAVIERQQQDLAQSADLLGSVKDYAIFMLDPQGRVMSWSSGAERVKGYSAEEILGKPLSTFYASEDVELGVPDRTLAETSRLGQYETEGWRVRKDGSRFWANIVSTAVHDDKGQLLGFTHIARDVTERRHAEERIQALNEQLESQVRDLAAANEEITRRGRAHAAVAIENARLYEEASTARDQLQAWSTELEAKVAERTGEIERYTKELTARVLQAQEEERKRLARELHDDTAQSLSTLLINVDLLEPFLPADSGQLRGGLDRIRDLTKRTLDTVRALSHGLRPTILDDFGLVAALRWYVDEYEDTFGVHVDVEIGSPREPLTPDVELALFRIAQEALTNSGKYADAARARLTLTFPDSRAVLTIADNGKGFDRQLVSGPSKHGGLGLYGMQERADLLGATLNIVTQPGKGTRVTVSVPLISSQGAGMMSPSVVEAGTSQS